MKILTTISEYYMKCLKIYLEVLLAIMVIVIGIQIFFRFILSAPLAWSEELTTLLHAALLFPGIAYCIKNKSHIEMTAVYERMPAGLKTFFDAIANITLVICGIYFINSVMIFLTAQKQTSHTMPWLRLDTFYQVVLWGAITTEIYLLSDCVHFFYSVFVRKEAKK